MAIGKLLNLNTSELKLNRLLLFPRFFYADERNQDGAQKGMDLDGDAHADFYAELAKQERHFPSQAPFVKGQGYVKFE